MLDKNNKPYCWDKEPQPNSFVPLDKYSSKPCDTKYVENCQSQSDFFNYFINDKMINMIVNSTNR